MAARSRSFALGSVIPAWLEPRLGSRSLRVLDVRTDAAAYRRGHVPSAVAFDARALLFDGAGKVVSAPELALAMSGVGVGDDHTVVLVDDGHGGDTAIAAARVLVRYGHVDVHVLEGGFARWTGEGRSVSRELVRLAPASYTARVFS